MAMSNLQAFALSVCLRAPSVWEVQIALVHLQGLTGPQAALSLDLQTGVATPMILLYSVAGTSHHHHR